MALEGPVVPGTQLTDDGGEGQGQLGGQEQTFGNRHLGLDLGLKERQESEMPAGVFLVRGLPFTAMDKTWTGSAMGRMALNLLALFPVFLNILITVCFF